MGEEDDVDGTRALLWTTLPMRLWGQPQPSVRAILDVLGSQALGRGLCRWKRLANVYPVSSLLLKASQAVRTPSRQLWMQSTLSRMTSYRAGCLVLTSKEGRTQSLHMRR